MEKTYIFTSFILLLILISGCDQVDVGKLSDQDLGRIADKAIVCNEPYIRHASGCCLDSNSNNICDNDENSANTNKIDLEVKENEEPENNKKPENENLKLGEKHIKGDADAPVTIYEWSDFECPFCARFYEETLDKIEQNYIETGHVKFIFRHLPLSFHQNAMSAAMASECAAEQGEFWKMHDLLFEHGVEGGKDTYKEYAQELNLDINQFNSCLDSDKYADKIREDMAAAQEAGISGTPGFIINGERFVGAQPYAAFEAAIKGEIINDEDEEEDPAPSNPTINEDMEVVADDDAFKGDADAPVTIVEFSDFECPFCARFYEETLPQIESNYINTGKVKLVYRDLPLSFHANAQKAGEAGECAADQDMFWEMHDALFDNGVSGGVTAMKQYAADLGLNTADFNDCLDSGKYAQEIKDDASDAQKYGISGTPGFIINGERVVGAQPYGAFEAAIDRELNN